MKAAVRTTFEPIRPGGLGHKFYSPRLVLLDLVAFRTIRKYKTGALFLSALSGTRSIWKPCAWSMAVIFSWTLVPAFT